MQKKKVLFVCVENSCRSQMAEALSKEFAKDKFLAFSAGSNPSGKVNYNAIAVLKEIGIDISQAKSKGFNDLEVRDFDYAVTLGCKDTCPFVPADKHIEWDIPDPKNHDIDFFRKTRDNIKAKVLELSKTIE